MRRNTLSTSLGRVGSGKGGGGGQGITWLPTSDLTLTWKNFVGGFGVWGRGVGVGQDCTSGEVFIKAFVFCTLYLRN